MNNRSKNLVLGLSLALATPSLAFAEEFYATVQLGYSEQATESTPIGNNIAVDPTFPGKFDAGDGTVGGIGIGFRINEQFRVEGRLSYRDGSFNEMRMGMGARAGEQFILDGDIKSTALTIEGFYDFPTNTPFTPYIKAGLGVSDNKYSAKLGGTGVAAFDAFDGVVDGFYDAYADGDSTELSWNVGFGGNFELSENVSIYGEYQYASFGDVKTGQDSFTDGFQIDGIEAHEVVVGVRIYL